MKERKELTRRMLFDVLGAVTQSKTVDQTIVVCSDKKILKGKTFPNVKVFNDGIGEDLNIDLKAAVQYCMKKSVESLLILPGDIPLIQATEIELIVNSSSCTGVVIVPSRDELGTNALLLRPPNVISPAFGSNSYQSHLSLATTQDNRCEDSQNSENLFGHRQTEGHPRFPIFSRREHLKRLPVEIGDD